MRPPVEKNDIIELNIDNLGSEGQGIGRIGGYAVFVAGALPGERVRAQVIKVNSGYCVAKLREILCASPDRIQPECPAFPRCGGCTLMHMNYAAQLDYKQSMVKEALVRIGGMTEPPMLPIIGMERPCRYRNKGSFPFGMEDGSASMGFFSRRSHRIVPIEDCPIQDERIVGVARTVREWARRYAVQPYDERTRSGVLRHAMARSSEQGVLALVVTAQKLPYKEELAAMLRERIPGLVGVVHNLNPDDTNVILGSKYSTVWGDDRLRTDILGVELSVSMASFLQVNPTQTAALYSAALDMLQLTGGERVADIYCGTGSISLLLAKRAKEVIGIEYVHAAIEDAKLNAVRNGITNARFIAGAAESVLPRLTQEGLSLSAAVIDPPRKGCDAAVLKAIAASGTERIAYVSCNPSTLARDCRMLTELGYSLRRVQPVDMFPWSEHVETVCLLSKLIVNS